MEAYAAVLLYAIPGFVVLIIIESLVAKWRGIRVNNPMDTISSLSSGMTNTLKSLLGLTLVIVSYEWMVGHIALLEIKSSFLLYVLAFIGLDFAGYWSHRFNHEINLMWNRHIVHHSSEEFNLSCALRQSISEFVGVYFFLYIPLALLGVPAQIVAVVAPLHLFAQFWYHTRLVHRMGFLEHIIVTPSHHRVHHAINPQYLDKNYAQIFIVWDKWFGTFQEELPDEPAVYGTKRPAGTWNPILINFMHLWILIQDAWRTKSWWDKLRIWFMPTGWRPTDIVEKYPVAIIEDVHNRKKYDTTPSLSFQVWSWVQLIVHNLFIFHMMVDISNLSFAHIALYSGFLMISIFSFTSAMDHHPISIPTEIIKCAYGIFILWILGSWFGLEQIIPGASYVILGYMLVSVVCTFYFVYFEKSTLNIKLPA